MNIQTMRRMERWIGIPLTIGLTAVRKIAEFMRYLLLKPENHISPVDRSPRVLLVKLAEMGSTVIALPAIQRLKDIYPDVRLHYLCFDENKAVLDLLPGIDWEGVHTIRTRSLEMLVRDSLRILVRLRKLQFEAAIDLEIFSRASASLVYLSGARRRVGFHRFRAEGLYCGDLFTHRLNYNNHLHTSGAFLAMVEALAADPREIPMLKQPLTLPTSLPAFQPTDQERQSVLQKLRDRGYPTQSRCPILILNANASDLLPLRRWPIERFEQLAKRCLAAHDDLWIVLTGAPPESAAIEALARRLHHPRVISLAGYTTLRELLMLYVLSDVLITNDSGPAHFAALTPIQIISLFGPETPELYCPISPRNQSLTSSLACSPCIHVFNARDAACQDNQCMKIITVDDVFTAFERAYQQRFASKRNQIAAIQ